MRGYAFRSANYRILFSLLVGRKELILNVEEFKSNAAFDDVLAREIATSSPF